MTFPEDEKPFQPNPEAADEPAGEPEITPFAEQVPPFPAEAEALPEFDFPQMDEEVAAFQRELDQAHFTPAIRPRDEAPLPPSAPRRRRRSQPLVQRPDLSELGARLQSIAYRAAPTFDFFVFSFLSACLLGLGYILDYPAILLLGLLVAPIVAPWVGAALAAATGEIRFLGQTIGGFFSALLMVFLIGLLAGFSSRIFQPLTTSQALLHSRLWWPDLLVLLAGTIILVISFIQSENKPTLASLMVAYELYLPASAAGFGLGSGVPGLWPEAGKVFLIHLALSLIVSLVVFFYMGFRPLETSGYALAGGIVVLSLALVAGFTALDSLGNVQGDQPTATPQAAGSITSTPRPVAAQPVATARSTATFTPVPNSTQELPPTPTLGTTPSPTLLPTPVYGRVQSQGDGATIRTSPGGNAITTIQNGYLVEILADKPAILEGTTWIHVIVKTPARDIDGWMLLSLITTATPSGSP